MFCYCLCLCTYPLQSHRNWMDKVAPSAGPPGEDYGLYGFGIDGFQTLSRQSRRKLGCRLRWNWWVAETETQGELITLKRIPFQHRHLGQAQKAENVGRGSACHRRNTRMERESHRTFYLILRHPPLPRHIGTRCSVWSLQNASGWHDMPGSRKFCGLLAMQTRKSQVHHEWVGRCPVQ